MWTLYERSEGWRPGAILYTTHAYKGAATTRGDAKVERRHGRAYTVSVNIRGKRGCQGTIPMPLIDMLGRSNRITFHVRGGEIVVMPGPEGVPNRPSKRCRNRHV